MNVPVAVPRLAPDHKSVTVAEPDAEVGKVHRDVRGGGFAVEQGDVLVVGGGYIGCPHLAGTGVKLTRLVAVPIWTRFTGPPEGCMPGTYRLAPMLVTMPALSTGGR